MALRLEHKRPDYRGANVGVIGRFNAYLERNWQRAYRWDCNVSVPAKCMRNAVDASAALDIDVVGLVKYVARGRLKDSQPLGSFIFLLSFFGGIQGRRD